MPERNDQDIHDRVLRALRWARDKYGCEGCGQDQPSVHHPVCIALYELTVNSGARGRVVLRDAHPAYDAAEWAKESEDA